MACRSRSEVDAMDDLEIAGLPEPTGGLLLEEPESREMTRWNALERSPVAANRLAGENEETLRDFLLIILNTRWKGGAASFEGYERFMFLRTH